jgi:threonine dehydrogenase-like Zn-dependent dehydrogenase
MVANVDVPQSTGDEVLIQVLTSSMDGTDLEQIHGRHTITATRDITQGHEYAGRVVTIGESVTAFSLGDRVTGPFGVHCGSCTYCRRGQTNLCLNQTVFGFGRDGAWAEYMLAPERVLTLLPEPLSFDDGALLCCTVPTILRAMDRSPITPGDHVAVFGLGQMGLTAVMAASMENPATLIAVDPVGSRRQLASRWGATHSLDPSTEDTVTRVLDITNGVGANLCIITASSLAASGPGSVASKAFDSVARSGQVTVIGLIGDQIANFNHLISKEFHVVGSKASLGPTYVARAVAQATEGTWPMTRYREIITHRVALNDLPTAIATDRLRGAIKILITPPVNDSQNTSEA